MAAALAIGGQAAILAAPQSPRISTGDQLKIVVANIDMGATEFTVDTEGTINYPYLGKIKVAGMTSTELAAKVGADLVTEKVLTRAPQIMVDLKQLDTKTVTLSGAVVNKGPVNFAGQISLFDALVKAGGAAADAGDNISVRRRAAQPGGEPEITVVSRRELEAGDFSKNMTLQDGDVVIVAKALQVFVEGYVNSPNGYVMPPGTTLRQAITLAGGVQELGALNRVQVVRNGKPVDAKLTKEIDKFVVQPGDTVIVPKRKM